MGLLLKKYLLPTGLTAEQAYMRIDAISGNKSYMTADLKFFISKEAADDGLSSIDQKFLSFVPDVTDGAPNYHKQAYEHLKTMPEYDGAIDVLEQGQIV